MKVRQRVTKTETMDVEVEFPLYVQHDVGDERTYVVTYRYELKIPSPTFLVTKITQDGDDWHVSRGQSTTVDSDVAASSVSEETWNEAVAGFEKWSDKCLKLLKGTSASPAEKL